MASRARPMSVYLRDHRTGPPGTGQVAQHLADRLASVARHEVFVEQGSAEPVAQVHVTKTSTHGKRKFEAVPSRQRGMREIECHSPYVEIRRVRARGVGAQVATPDAPAEHVLDRQGDPVAFAKCVNGSFEPLRVASLEPERRMHDDGVGSDGTCEFGRPFKLHGRAQAPDELISTGAWTERMGIR